MSAQWYLLRSKPNKDEALWRELLARSYDVFYPQLHVRPVNPRSRKVRPYFPGYLFINIDLPVVGFSALAWIPHSHGLVFFDKEPALVPDALIADLRRHIEAVNAAGGERPDGMKQGEAVLIQTGPFTGYEAIFDARLAGSERVRVLLKLLNNYQVPLELPTIQIKRIRRR
jgi:transcription antitermination factor NusG